MSFTAVVRPVRPEDVPAVVAMVHELAAFERAAEQCRLTVEQLERALFTDRVVSGHVATDAGDRPVGFALWFVNFSTWTGTAGIHLEDLFVRPEARGTGAGGALLAALAEICVSRAYERLEWVMLDWNPAAEFYAAIGAEVVADWVPYRLSGAPLHRLAERASPAARVNR
ncbi:GNAT family N-acetyltransferase [Paractinoplanes rishiriensis]|uniref:N-acetyltransferase n=1 Tax=Paractinoplanes rishiriensis TaxID=1050105 RepID=A0A919JRV1_9ACTN|nr:GNAT family N-acetyltransferase [Actinoplanes rishiriensis]GIE94006.1 N-acetyltransferase [Actinoplanes rishiriensis]